MHHATTIASEHHDVALGATMAAPVPSVAGPDFVPPPSSSMPSVLPAVESARGSVRLVPQSGPRYHKVRALGAGAMGEVALVEDRDIGRPVAVKRLLSGPHGTGALARFVDEVRIVGKLEHPNIVPIHDVGVDEDGGYFFVMKYVEGETLEQVIDRLRAGDAEYERRFDFTRRVEIFMAILRALEYAHERGILHRDIKPANVMIGRFGEVVLMDWGVARPIGGQREGDGDGAAKEPAIHGTRASSTHAGSLIGSPLYMSPEQAQGKNDSLDARSDLYSACVLFHEFLGLRNRYEDIAELTHLIVAIVTRDPPPVPKLFAGAHAQRGAIPAELAHFLRRGLARDPAERWQSATEMLAELHAILDGRCRVQCPVTFTKRVMHGISKAADRGPMLILAGSGLLAVTFVTAVVLAVRGLLG